MSIAVHDDTIIAVLRRAADRVPNKSFVEFSGVSLSYEQTLSQSTDMARGLIDLGILPGDRVVTMLDNNPDAVLALFAINMIGAINVPMNTAYKGEFLRHQISDSGAEIIIIESEYVPRLARIANNLPKIRHVLQRNTFAEVADLGTLATSSLDEHRLRDGRLIDHRPSPSDLAYVMYTGGTTGPSKGCMLSNNYFCYMARTINDVRGTTEDDVLWNSMPMFHFNAAGSTVMSAALLGASASLYPRFSVSNFWPEVERTGATTVNLLASMLPLLAEAPANEAAERYFGKLETVFCVPSPPDIVAVWRKRFGVKKMVGSAYGLTEAANITSLRAGIEGPPGSSGRASADFDVKIFDDGDHEMPAGEPGEIVCRPKSPHIMFEGYWGNPEATVSVIRNLWFHTGDIGRFDEDGFFYFVDRKKDYLRRRGENVSSFEVEATFRDHEALKDIAIHAVPSALSEDDIKLTAVLNEGHTLTEKELCLWCLDLLPYFAVPRYFEFRTDLPRNPVGRILKYQLRDEGVTAATWDREMAGPAYNRR